MTPLNRSAEVWKWNKKQITPTFYLIYDYDVKKKRSNNDSFDPIEKEAFKKCLKIIYLK
jgi:hypothetical protein